MKIKAKILLVVALTLPVFAAGIVYADDMDQPSTTQTTETQKKTGNENLTLQQRLEKRKTELKTRLGSTEKLRLQARCKASQGVLTAVKARITGIETSRTTTYRNLIQRLTNLRDKLKAKGLDTAEYDQQITVLQTKVDMFHTDLAHYKEAVSDVVAMECATDPEAFKASLETARTRRQKLAQDGLDIRGYLSNTIKPTLQKLRLQLSTTSNTGEDN